jgi:hypothetical protein
MMAEKTKIPDRFALLVAGDMIHLLRRLQLLSEVNIYPVTQKPVIII